MFSYNSCILNAGQFKNKTIGKQATLFLCLTGICISCFKLFFYEQQDLESKKNYMPLSLDLIHLKCEISALLCSGKTLQALEKTWGIKQNKKILELHR